MSDKGTAPLSGAIAGTVFSKGRTVLEGEDVFHQYRYLNSE